MISLRLKLFYQIMINNGCRKLRLNYLFDEFVGGIIL